MTLDVARLRLLDSQYRIEKYINANIQQWAEEEILERAQKFAWQKGLSENAISYMWVETMKIGFKIKIDVIWDYRGPNDEPVSKFLENGTERHDIYAKGKLFGGADYLMWVDREGKPIFRKKVKHPGTKPMHIMKRAKEEGIPALKKRITREVQQWLEMTRIGR